MNTNNYVRMKNLLLLISLLVIVNINISGNVTKNNEDIFWKAVKLYSEENYAKALLYFTYVLDQEPVNNELNYYVGMCFHNLNKPKLANIYLSKAATDRALRLKIQLMTRDNIEVVNYFSGY